MISNRTSQIQQQSAIELPESAVAPLPEPLRSRWPEWRRFLLSTRPLAWLLLGALVYGYIAFMVPRVLLRFDTFHAAAFDIGNLDQAIWNTSQGHPFVFTNRGVDWYGPPTRLAAHVEPVILLLALFYLVVPGPRTLLVLQTIVLALGALPLFLLARRHLPRWPLLAPFFGLAYLLAPGIIGENIFDFHPVALASTFLLCAFYYLESERYLLFGIFALLSTSCKEDLSLVVALLGIYGILAKRQFWVGGTVVVLGCLWFAITFFFIIPHFDTTGIGNNYWYRYASLGRTPGAALTQVLRDPRELTGTLFTEEKTAYIAGLLRAGGFLSLLAPQVLVLILPSLAINLLSSATGQYSGVYHYNAAIVPFVILAALVAVTWLARVVPRWIVLRPVAVATLGTLWVVIAAILNLYGSQPALEPFWGPLAVSEHNRRAEAMLHLIPAEESVSADASLNPHVGDRAHLYLFPDIRDAHYIAVDMSKLPVDSRASLLEMLNGMVSSGSYIYSYNRDDLVLVRAVEAQR